ncbi:hypothetical protein [Streptomyces qinzhouensis]|uniref:Lipoprotein n=1 Tax=Streptomyces qinzhouensis TaxID=2599401 RepID=A0A5B8J9C9_9ACTN|nr:hypothetical protein [Streptomyces qinzhouensis]QDY76491.1 hypothetical protein FQU76_08005 [Streptomyces qinzhouensis]
MSVKSVPRGRAVVAMAICLIGLSACTSGSGGDDKPGIGDLGSGPTAGAVSKDGLAKAAIGAKDVPGHVVVAAGAAAVTGKEVTVGEDGKDCLPVAHALAGVPVGETRSITPGQRITGGGVTTTVTLGLYEGQGGQTAMETLSAALDKCAGGFGASVRGLEQKASKVARDLAPQGAEQAMAFTADVEAAGKTVPVKVVVFRKGTTVGWLSATGAPGKKLTFPAKVFEAQLVKLA